VFAADALLAIGSHWKAIVACGSALVSGSVLVRNIVEIRLKWREFKRLQRELAEVEARDKLVIPGNWDTVRQLMREKAQRDSAKHAFATTESSEIAHWDYLRLRAYVLEAMSWLGVLIVSLRQSDDFRLLVSFMPVGLCVVSEAGLRFLKTLEIEGDSLVRKKLHAMRRGDARPVRASHST